MKYLIDKQKLKYKEPEISLIWPKRAFKQIKFYFYIFKDKLTDPMKISHKPKENILLISPISGTINLSIPIIKRFQIKLYYE
jgi:hypothetical protein